MAFRKDNKVKNFTKIAIGLASPEEILERSSGAVLNRRRLTIVLTNPNATVCSANESSVR